MITQHHLKQREANFKRAGAQIKGPRKWPASAETKARGWGVSCAVPYHQRERAREGKGGGREREREKKKEKETSTQLSHLFVSHLQGYWAQKERE